MKFITICSLFLIFGCFCEVTGWWRSSRKDCIIPRGDLYDRATFRLQYGYDTRPLARGENVDQYIGVVVVCDKDILTDLITKYYVLTCHRGKWKPRLPDCQGPINCARLQPVANAISEVLLGNDVDYPHGTVLRYRCREGYTMKGHSERHCKNGLWDGIKFNCTRKPEGPKKCKNSDPVENAIAETMTGTDTEYPHGTVISYRCIVGYRLKGDDKVRCQNGTWEDVKFQCLRYEERCERLKDKFEIVNKIGSESQIESGNTVRLQCRWSWEPKDGVTVATCVNGEWKPKRPVCIAFCKLPRKGSRYFTYFGSGSPVVTSKVANRARVVQHCRTGLRKSTSTCLNGRWRPTFRYCPYGERPGRAFIDNCTLPNNPMAAYINSSGHTVDLTEEILHGAEIMQVCRGEVSGDVIFNESKSSFCHGGRWVPEFQNCTVNICGNRKLSIKLTDVNLPDQSYVDVVAIGFVDRIEECAIHCVNPANFPCKAIQVDRFVNDGVTELFCKLLSEVASNSSHKFITYTGSSSKIYNVQCEPNPNSIDDSDRALCTRPDIEFSTLSPDLEEYYAHEVVTVHCHAKFGSVNENITCQASGNWSVPNITCDAIEHNTHCHPPPKSRMVYWPLKDLYDVNDTLEVLTCREGLIPAGSSEMRCIANETWEGDFECLSSCENGVPIILATNFHYPRHKKMDIVVIGYVESASECARTCVEYANFTCKSIQVYIRIHKRKTHYFCKLLSETAYEGSDKFIEGNSRGSDIYNIQCDTSCRVPDENEIKFRVTDINGQRLKTNTTLPNGTILRVDCIDNHGGYKEQQTITCIAGRWSGPVC